jgi:hypothetical protein
LSLPRARAALVLGSIPLAACGGSKSSSGAGGAGGANGRLRTTTTFDADGIPTDVDYGNGTTGTYTTTSRATVCR